MMQARLVRADFGPLAHREEELRLARAAIERAVALAPEDPAILAWAALLDWAQTLDHVSARRAIPFTADPLPPHPGLPAPSAAAPQ